MEVRQDTEFVAQSLTTGDGLAATTASMANSTPAKETHDVQATQAKKRPQRGSLLSLHVDTLLLVLEYATAIDAIRLSTCTKATTFISSISGLWMRLLRRDFPQFKSSWETCSHKQQHVDIMNVDESSQTLEGILSRAAPRHTVSVSPQAPACALLAHQICPSTQYRYLFQAFNSPGCCGVEWSATLPHVNDILHRESHAQSVIPGNRVYVRMGLCSDPDAYVFQVPNAFHSETDSSVVVLEKRLKPQKVRVPNVYGHKISTIYPSRLTKEPNSYSSSTTPFSDDSGADETSETQSMPPFFMLQYGGCSGINYGGPLPLLTITTLNMEDGTLIDRPFRGPMGARAFHAQAVIGDFLYVFGGIVPGGRSDASMFCLDLRAALPAFVSAAADVDERPVISDERVMNACTRVPASWLKPVYGHSMSAVGSKLYIAGGFLGTPKYTERGFRQDLTNIAAYDTVTGLWEPIFGGTSVPLPRFLGRCHTANVYGPLIVFFGGTVDLSSAVVIFDTRTHDIVVPHVSHTGSSGPLPRHSHATSLVGTTLFVTGGYNADTLADARCCNLAAGLSAVECPIQLSKTSLASPPAGSDQNIAAIANREGFKNGFFVPRPLLKGKANQLADKMTEICTTFSGWSPRLPTINADLTADGHLQQQQRQYILLDIELSDQAPPLRPEHSIKFFSSPPRAY